jgi:uncharacterized membrane protein YgaE (UPF0421/DUF939 family)
VRLRIGDWLRTAAAEPRLLLAVKTAFAASVAWLLAPLIPFIDSNYSYYAPLGAVVSMYPTLVRSARSGFQSLLGLALGAGLAFTVLALGGPRVLSIALVVGIGVLLAGVRSLGEGRSWVPITALFVLLIGGVDADEYSVNYLVHMVLGVVVGLVVNLVVVPPLYLGTADKRLDRLRDLVADHLRDMAGSLESDDRSQRDGSSREWADAVADLEETGRDVRQAVQQADESRRGNPRGRRREGEIEQDYQRLRALERVLFYVRDLSDALLCLEAPDGRDAGDERRVATTEALPPSLPAAVRAVADLVGSRVRGAGSSDLLTKAEAALERLNHSVDIRATHRANGRPSAVADELTASVCLRRMVDSARPFVAPPNEAHTE